MCRACGRQRVEIRGVCRACYQAARYAIRHGQTTEEQVIEAGLLLPAYKMPRSHFRSELAEWLSGRKRRKKCQKDGDANQSKTA